MLSIGGDYIYNTHYRLNRTSLPTKPSVYLGWGYWLNFDIERMTVIDINNPLYYNFNNMACLALGIDWKINPKIRIFDELNLPIVGIYSGSEYGSSLPFFATEANGSFIDAFDILTFPNFQLQNKLSVDMQVNISKQIRTLRFQYAINVKQLYLNDINVHSVFHYIALCTQLKNIR
jgi:hypothetical protein